MGIFSRRKVEQRAVEFPFVLPTGNYLQPTQGPLNVSASTALGIPALWRCTQLISDSIASLPIVAFRDGEKITPNPSILEQPDRMSTRIDMIASTVASLLIDGNASWLLGDRDALGYPRQAVLLATDAVQMRSNGTLVQYPVRGQTYQREDILQIRRPPYPHHAPRTAQP